MKHYKHIKKTFERVSYPSTSGLACLASLVKYHGGKLTASAVSSAQPDLSVTDFYLMATKLGFHSEAYKSDVTDLKEMREPVVLQLFRKQDFYYAICYYFNGKFLLGDPTWGLVEYSEIELKALWRSQILFKLTPNENFVANKGWVAHRNQWLQSLPHPAQWIINIVLALILSTVFVLDIYWFHNLVEKILTNEAIASTLMILGVSVSATMVVAFLYRVYLSLTALQVKEASDHLFKQILGAQQSADASSRTVNSKISSLLQNQQRLVFTLSDSLMCAFILFTSIALIIIYSPLMGVIALLPLGWLFVRIVKAGQTKIVNEESIDLVNGFHRFFLTYSARQKKQAIHDLIDQYNAYSSDLCQAKHSTLKRQFFQQILLISAGTVFFTLLVHCYQQEYFAIPTIFIMVLLAGISWQQVHRLAHGYNTLKQVLPPLSEFYDMHKDSLLFAGEQQPLSFQIFDLENVAASYPGSKLIVRNFSVSIHPSELLVIYGSSGSGKTALFQSIKEKSLPVGTITLNGEDWRDVPPATWQQYAAFVDEEVPLFDGTLAENIMLGRTSDDLLPFVTFCQAHGIHALLESFPDSYVTLIDKEGANISKGQRQMIGLIRALYQRPPMLFLDEPTIYWDEETEVFFLKLLYRFKTQTSIILFTNQSRLLDQADRSHSLSDNKLVIYTDSMTKMSA